MKIVLFVLIVTLFSASYAADLYQEKVDLKVELNDSEFLDLKARKFVIKTQDVTGSSWPEITYYALIDSTPLESIGLFAAYDIQKDYVPNLIKSSVVKHLTATEVLTEYEHRTPFPLSNAHYTHRSRLSQLGDDYVINWSMVKSTSTDEVRGNAYFTPYDGKTLFRYRSYVKPKSMLGSFVKKIMFKNVFESIVAIRNFIEKNKSEQSTLNAKYSKFITRALLGEFVYQTNIEQK